MGADDRPPGGAKRAGRGPSPAPGPEQPAGRTGGPTDRARAHWRRLVVLALAGSTVVIVFALNASVAASAVGPLPGQTTGSVPTTTTSPGGGGSITTTSNLLNGPTTAVPVASTTSTTRAASGQGSASDQAADDTRTVWYIVAGLVAVAVAIGILTALYWRRTRPDRSVVGDEADR